LSESFDKYIAKDFDRRLSKLWARVRGKRAREKERED
jgi:hypothetical protein